MNKTFYEIIAKVDACIQKELRQIYDENEKIRNSKITRAYKLLYKVLPWYTYHVENDFFLRGISFVILRSKIIKAVYENNINPEDCLSGTTLDLILPSNDCKTRLNKVDVSIIPTAGSAADCKWVLVAYLWIMREKGIRIILQRNVWNKARKYFIDKITTGDHQYSEFFDSNISYEELVKKYDLFKSDLDNFIKLKEKEIPFEEKLDDKLNSLSNDVKKNITNNTDRILTENSKYFNKIQTEEEKIEEAITKQNENLKCMQNEKLISEKEFNDKLNSLSNDVRKNITNNTDRILTENSKHFNKIQTEEEKIEGVITKQSENLKNIWNGKLISEKETDYQDRLLRETLAKIETSGALKRMTVEQKNANGLSTIDPVYVIQKGNMAYVFSNLFKVSLFSNSLIEKYLMCIDEEIDPSKPQPIKKNTLKKYRDNSRTIK